MRFSEPSGRVLRAASREARHLGPLAVGTGHLLQALLCDEDLAASGLPREPGARRRGYSSFRDYRRMRRSPGYAQAIIGDH